MKKVIALIVVSLFIGGGGAVSQIFLDVGDVGVKTFPDVPEDYIYHDAIFYLSDEMVVNGYPDGTFQPDKKVNRAEMLKILVVAVGVEKTPEWLDKLNEYIKWEYHQPSCFPDVPAWEWYSWYVCYAKDADWVKGYNDGTFRPEQTITFVEALKLTFKAFGLDYSEDKEPWYRKVVEFAANHNYIPFSVGAFHESVSRGVMSDLAARIKIGTQNGALALEEYLGERSGIVVDYESIEAGMNLAD